MNRENNLGFVRTARWALGAAVLLCVGVANAAGKLDITNAVFQEIEVTTEDGRVERRQVPATRVVPGTEVIYVVSYRNVGDGPVANVAITNPVPAELSYVGAAGPIAVSEVSVDRGAAYGELQDLTVPGPDGEPRPAEPGDVTHLRWMLPSLAPGADGAVSFRAKLK